MIFVCIEACEIFLILRRFGQKTCFWCRKMKTERRYDCEVDVAKGHPNVNFKALFAHKILNVCKKYAFL